MSKKALSNRRTLNKALIRKLAEETLNNSRVNEKVARFALETLKKSELKLYLLYLQETRRSTTIEFTTAGEVSSHILKSLEKQLGAKLVIHKSDPTLGGGFILKIGDNRYDMSLKGYIDTTIDKINT